MLPGAGRFQGCRLQGANDSTCFSISHYVCPWSHLVAILAKTPTGGSESSRLTNEGTAEPRQVLGGSLASSSTALQPNQQGQPYIERCLARSSCLCSRIAVFNLLSSVV